ncbi:hypothetical protein QBC32DRAFT_344164 [Pseudoneurospora amorphoporcata]|uniref:FAD-binding PCMH-type domain-containing protein n=1 Tax=Pseudoneurospora amorphoporcata TaxID=241081 RepID=A0AAN6NWG9_9PEZI|nr:hypothetical protein QBC32DRAFT_344164 [Pseudoneurospora amorphoporcata]
MSALLKLFRSTETHFLSATKHSLFLRRSSTMSVPKTDLERAAAARDLLKSTFGQRVTTFDDAASGPYVALRAPWSTTCHTRSAAYFQPVSPAEVSTALSIITKTQSKFAVRATGHNPNPGFSSTHEDGVIIDLHRLDTKSFDEETGIASVGAGNTWGEVYTWLEGKGRSVMGGRYEEIGVAGFCLGGGMPGFVNLRGMGCDQVRGFEVVLGDGNTVYCSAHVRPDLYRALKGGGSNFGVVTRFDLQTYPLLKTQYTVSLYKPDDYANIIRASVDAHKEMEHDPKAAYFTNVHRDFVAIGQLYADTPKEEPKVFEPFKKLDSMLAPVVPKTDGTLSTLAQAIGHRPPKGKRVIFTISTKVDQDLYLAIHNIWQDVTATLPSSADGTDLHYTIQPVTAAAARAGRDNGTGGNALGLKEVSQNWYVFTLEYPKNGHDSVHRTAMDSIYEQVKKTAEDKGLLLDFVCPTFADKRQDVLRGFGEENVGMIKEVAAKYDGHGVFQKLQYGGFLVRDLL